MRFLVQKLPMIRDMPVVAGLRVSILSHGSISSGKLTRCEQRPANDAMAIPNIFKNGRLIGNETVAVLAAIFGQIHRGIGEL